MSNFLNNYQSLLFCFTVASLTWGKFKDQLAVIRASLLSTIYNSECVALEHTLLRNIYRVGFEWLRGFASSCSYVARDCHSDDWTAMISGISGVAEKGLVRAQRQWECEAPEECTRHDWGEGGGRALWHPHVWHLWLLFSTMIVALAAPHYGTHVGGLIGKGLTRLSLTHFLSVVWEESGSVVFHLVIFRIHHFTDVINCWVCH